MHQEFFSYNHQDEEIVKRYEHMLSVDRVSYFDVEEFEVIAEHYLDNLKLKLAFNVIEHAVLQHPHSAPLRLLHAKALMKKGSYQKALNVLDKIGSLLPSDTEFWMLKGELHLKLDQVKSADASYVKVLALDDEDKDQTCLEIAYQFMGIDQMHYAIKYFKACRKFNPKNSDVLFELGGAYLELEQYDKALYYLNLQLDIDPYLEETWFTIGLIYWDKKANYTLALEAFDYVLVINEKHEMAQFFKGQIYFKKGDYHQAIDHYHTFGEMSNQQAQASLLIAECYEELEDTDNAIRFYHKALQDESNRFDAWLGLGYCYVDKKEYRTAIGFFKEILNEKKDYEEAWSGMGDCFFALGHEDMAIQAYEKSLSINANQPELWSVYGDVYISLGQYEKALTVLEKGLANCAVGNDLKFQLAICHFQMCNYEDCRIVLRELKGDNYKKLDKFYEFCPEAKINNSFAQIVKM